MEFKDMSTRKKSNYDEIIRETKVMGGFKNNKIYRKIFDEKFVVSGEKAGTLFARFLKEILTVLIIFAVVAGFVFSSSEIKDFFADSDYTAISTDIDYSKAVSVDLDVSVSESSANFVLDTIANWSDLTGDYSISTDYLSPKYMSAELEVLLGDGFSVNLNQGMDSYDLFEAIYESVKAGCPVIISGVNAETLSLEYGVVVAFSPSDSEITVMTKSGDEHVLTLEEFVAYVGFDDFMNTNESLFAKMLVWFGVFNQNTAIFVSK